MYNEPQGGLLIHGNPLIHKSSFHDRPEKDQKDITKEKKEVENFGLTQIEHQSFYHCLSTILAQKMDKVKANPPENPAYWDKSNHTKALKSKSFI